MTGLRLLVGLFAAVLTIGLASPAQAQRGGAPRKAKQPAAQPAAKPAAKAASKPDKAAGTAKGERKTAGRKVVRLEEMRVEGRVQKPQALFLMPRANVNDPAEHERNESFLSKATDAVKKDPF